MLINILLALWIIGYVGVLIGQLIGTNPQAVAGTAALLFIPWGIGLAILWVLRTRVARR
jgi:hypothetical protein